MTPDVRICAGPDELSRRAADAAARTMLDAVQRRGRCAVALSGGNTPRGLYERLASDYQTQIPWEDVHIFWGDERYVPADDPDSNYRMASETLLAHVPCPRSNVHPMPVWIEPPDAAARQYEHQLREFFGSEDAVFDLVLLGLGADGHTASLFPGSPALSEARHWVSAVHVSVRPAVRLTLTLPLLTRAASIFVLAAGASKANALAEVLSGRHGRQRYPASGLLQAAGTLIWWADRPAASQLAATPHYE